MIERKLAKGIQHKPDLDGNSVDLVIIGGGPAGLHLAEELQHQVGSDYSIVLLEQADILGGSGNASMQQLRTYQANGELVAMIADTRQWYEDLQQSSGQPGIIIPLPYLFIAADDEQLARFSATLAKVQGWGYGNGAEILQPKEVTHRWPFLDGEVAGGLWYPEATQVNFDAAIAHITATAKNTTFALGTPMTEVIVEDGRVTRVVTPRGSIRTENVVFCSGPFILHAPDRIIGGDLGLDGSMSHIVEVKMRQRFTALIRDLPPNTRIFVVAPGGEYVRIHTDKDGSGCGDHGYADPADPPEYNPVVRPRATGLEFPAIVYCGLGRVMSAYGTEEILGRLARQPLPGSRIAGYYVQTRDDKPIITETGISGVYLNIAHSHVGIMNRGGAKMTARMVLGKDVGHNPFSLPRDFTEEGITL